MKIWNEFKEFAFKGNVLDMAVGVIVGQAFSKIVTSIVSDLVMPFFGFVTSGMKFTDLKLVLNEETEAAITYGNFIQNVVDFVIIAFSVFIFVRLINKTRDRFKKEEPVVEEAPKAPTAEELLTEIRDLLKKD